MQKGNRPKSVTDVRQERPSGGGDTRAVVKNRGWDPLADEQKNKRRYIHTMECYLAVKRIEVLRHPSAQMHLNDAGLK